MKENQAELEEALGGLTDFQILKHYDGAVELEYSPSLHAYTTMESGVRRLVPGSTSVVATLDKSGPLTQWAANMTVEWLLQSMNNKDLRAAYENIKQKLPWDDVDARFGAMQILLPDVAAFAKLLNEARFNYRAISKDATDVGHMAHEWLENYIKRMLDPYLLPAPLPNEARAGNCIAAALGWFSKHKFRPIFSEKKLYSRTYCYAGTCDWLAYVTSCGDHTCCPFDGEALVLGDFKSSRSLYDEYRLQLASYRQAIEEEFPSLQIGACTLLRLGKEDGEFEVLTVTQECFEDDLTAFLGLLEVYHWQKQIDLDVRYEKKSAKAAERQEKERLKAEQKALKAATMALKPKAPRKRKAAVVREVPQTIAVEIPTESKIAEPALSIPVEGEVA